VPHIFNDSFQYADGRIFFMDGPFALEMNGSGGRKLIIVCMHPANNLNGYYIPLFSHKQCLITAAMAQW
jgi:hypothetical protein